MHIYAALETVDYFLRRGSEVFMCTLDMTKAFDVTVHSLLFSKVFKAGRSTIVLRLLIFIYSEQFDNVRWNGVSSPCIMEYAREASLVQLHTAYIVRNCLFLGLLGYSDDNICSAPSLNALQDMLETCESYAAAHTLRFSTDINLSKCKTKNMAFLKESSSSRKSPPLW